MTLKSFIGLALLTGVITAAAAVGVISRYGSSGAEVRALKFPGLAEKINTAAELSVQSAEGTVVIRRSDTGWRVVSNHDYPALDTAVREAIIGLSQMRLVDAKTKMPERFSRLDVDDVTAKNSRSRLWRLKDADGKLLADLVVGKRRYDLGGGEQNGVYIRKPDEQQVWLAQVKLPDDRDGLSWIDRKIVDIRKKRIKRITTIAANGETLTALREFPDDEDYVVENLPADFRLKDRWQWDVNGMGLTLTGMQLDAVMPIAMTGKDFAGPSVEKAVVETHDGLILRLAMLPQSSDANAPWWVTLEADVDAGVKADPSGEGPDRIGTPEEVQKEAKDIDAKTKGWAYQLTESQLRSLRTRLADIKAPASGS